jgi:hypothetical protein
MKHLAAGLVAILAASALAQAPLADPDPMTGVKAPFEALKLSQELARAGHAHRDPWSLVVAARIRKLTPLQDSARAPDRGKPDASARDQVEAWLAEAEELGGDDPRISGLVREVRGMSFKGRTGGPQVSKARLAPGAIHQYGEIFQIGRPAVVYIEGDGDTDLTLVVRDPFGGPACVQGGPGDVKMCAWNASRGGRYAVEVRNPGRVDNAYALATN